MAKVAFCWLLATACAGVMWATPSIAQQLTTQACVTGYNINECGGTGASNYLHDDSTTDGGPYPVSQVTAYAFADYGHNAVLASTVSNGVPNIGSFETASASSSWFDTIQVQSATSALLVHGDVYLHGIVATQNDPNNSANATSQVSYSFDASRSTGGSLVNWGTFYGIDTAGAVTSFLSGPATQIGLMSDPTGSFYDFIIPVTSGEMVNLGSTLSCRATSDVHAPDITASGLCNFAGSGYWAGISSVTDSLGNPVTDWSITSASGTNYAQSFVPETVGGVPEPATWAMMLLGFGGIGWSMRRKNSRTAFPQIA